MASQIRRAAYLALVCLSTWLPACDSDSDATDGAADARADVPADAASMLPKAAKGYELYSWRSNDQWCFTLISGTNRNKDLSEIGAPDIEEAGWVRITRCGIPAIEAQLARLPAGELVLFANPGFVSDASAGPDLVMPPVEIVNEVKSFCALHDLVFLGPA